MTSSRQDLKGSKSKEIIAIAQGPKFKPQYCAKREREREERIAIPYSGETPFSCRPRV
jgi:hypothetical protein